MKGVRIKFELIEDDGKASLTEELVMDGKLLKRARIPILPLAAQQVAEKFWEAAVLMGATEE